jgi:dipeptidyl aminopeptidase/acylaminoacyl peptidase
VETPILLLHSEGDLRCPISQTEEFYTALKRLGKTSVMVRYPGEFHGPRRPLHRLDRYQRLLAWFGHFRDQQ